MTYMSFFFILKLCPDFLLYVQHPSADFYLWASSDFPFFGQKRQWQDLNLRIQRIIDFKSIALDHSATLSYTDYHTSPYPIQQSDRQLYYTQYYILIHHYIHISLYQYITIGIYPCRHLSLYRYITGDIYACCPHWLPTSICISVISNSIVG